MFVRSVDGEPEQLKSSNSRIATFLNRLVSVASIHRRERRLRLCEMLSLGEKRFIAVVEYDRQKFLLAGTPQNISLLQRLAGNLDSRSEPPRPDPSLEKVVS